MILLRTLQGFLLSSVLFASTSSCTEVRGKVQWDDLCPDSKSLGSARAILDDGSGWWANVHSDGGFAIRDVSEGRYVLSISAHDHIFDQVMVDIGSNDSAAVPVISPYIPGTPMAFSAPVVKLPYPIQLVARRKNHYYVPPEKFNLFAMFQNPMMLLMAVVGIMAFATPYLMKNMDPEALKELEESRSRVTKMQTSLQNLDIAGGILGSTAMASSDTKGSTSDKKVGSSSQTKRPSKAKRR